MGVFNFGGQLILLRTLNRPSIFIRTKAFVRSMNEIYYGIFYSLHFSCSWRTEQILSTVDRPERNISVVSLFYFVFIQSDYFDITHTLWDIPFLPVLTDNFNGSSRADCHVMSWSDQVVYCQVLVLCHWLNDQWHC